MKTLSIIGIVFFSLLLLVTLSAVGELSDPLEEMENLSNIATIFDESAGLTDFTDTVWGLGGVSLLANLGGLALSIVGCVTSSKKS